MTSAGDTPTVLAGPPRRVLVAGCIGNAVEWYDFAIYGALGVVIAPLFFPHTDQVLLSAFALYGVAFLVRPFGAVLFGRRGDVLGRRAVLVAVVALMTGATGLIGLLPVYASIGLAAPVCLLLLRIGQGLAAGGELGVAAVFLVEHAPAGRRGFFGAWHTATLALGLAAGLLVGGLLTRLPDDTLTGGGWRVAFLLALPLGLIGVYLRRHVPETPRFVLPGRSDAATSGSVGTLWTHHRFGLVTGFGVIAAGSLMFNTFFVFMPNHLADTSPLRLPATLFTAVVGLVSTAAASVILGRVSDRVGRRPVVLWSIAALVVCALPLSLLAHSGSLVALTLAEIVAGTIVGGILSVSMLTEMFPAHLRATGLGLTAGLASALVGGTAPLVDQLLFLATGSATAPIIYVMSVGCLALLLARSWPETAFRPLD